MDELLGMAFQAIANAAKAKGEVPGSPEAAERYRQMVAALQAQQSAQAPQVAVAAPAAAVPAPSVGARSSQRPAVAQTAHDREESARLAASRPGGALSGLFEDGNSLLRAVVASEVLAPPLGLRENPNWLIRRPPNEPST